MTWTSLISRRAKIWTLYDKMMLLGQRYVWRLYLSICRLSRKSIQIYESMQKRGYSVQQTELRLTQGKFTCVEHTQIMWILNEEANLETENWLWILRIPHVKALHDDPLPISTFTNTKGLFSSYNVFMKISQKTNVKLGCVAAGSLYIYGTSLST